MFHAFTQKGKGIQHRLITDCGISLPFDPHKGFPKGGPHKFTALWDTGASGTVISQNVVATLGLKPVGKTKAFHANGSAIVNLYLVNIYLPNQIAFSTVTVSEGVLNGFDVLIGMDIITTGDFSVTNVGGNTTFSFRIPSTKEIDYHAEMAPAKSQSSTHDFGKVGRNDTCPCGSGKKYKFCHGGSNPPKSLVN